MSQKDRTLLKKEKKKEKCPGQPRSGLDAKLMGSTDRSVERPAFSERKLSKILFYLSLSSVFFFSLIVSSLRLVMYGVLIEIFFLVKKL